MMQDNTHGEEQQTDDSRLVSNITMKTPQRRMNWRPLQSLPKPLNVFPNLGPSPTWSGLLLT